MSRKNSCKYTLKAAPRSDILYFFVREMLLLAGNFEEWCLWQPCAQHVSIMLLLCFLCLPVDDCIR